MEAQHNAKRPSFESVSLCDACEGRVVPMVDEQGVVLCSREFVVPQNHPASMGSLIGGRSFLKGYKVCQSCGLVTTYNLTALGLDRSLASSAPAQAESPTPATGSWWGRCSRWFGGAE